MTNGPLPDEVVLLAYGIDGVARGTGGRTGYGVAGAVLLELTLADRIAVADRRVVVRQPASTGDPILDSVLGRIAAASKPRSPTAWVTALTKGALPPVLDRLVDAGVLRRVHDQVFWIFPRTRYPGQYDGVESPNRAAVRQRLRAAACGSRPTDPRTAALCALVSALGWERLTLPDLPAELVKARFEPIRQRLWPAEAVKEAIANQEAAATTSTITIASAG